MFPSRSALTELRLRSFVSVALKNLLTVLMPTSLPSRLENGDDLVSYNPHRFVLSSDSTKGRWPRLGRFVLAFEMLKINTLGQVGIACLRIMPRFIGQA